MVEQYVDRVHTEPIVLDIGAGVGALIIYTREELRGQEIEVSLKKKGARRIHTGVWARKNGGRIIFTGVFPSLPEGNYTIWSDPIGDVTIVGGQIAEVDWSDLDAPVPYARRYHSHGYDMPFDLPPLMQENISGVCATGPRDVAGDLLPSRYRIGKGVSAAPMGAAPMRYDADGQVAWDEMWTGFCDLALAGGPSHRGTLLEPVTPIEVQADQAGYERVVAEIERGLRLVTGLPTVRSQAAGWVGLQCEGEEMALWLLRAIVVENVCVRREGATLFFPAGPRFRLDAEIKNVITVVAKTNHYWKEHFLICQGASSRTKSDSLRCL